MNASGARRVRGVSMTGRFSRGRRVGFTVCFAPSVANGSSRDESGHWAKYKQVGKQFIRSSWEALKHRYGFFLMDHWFRS